MDEWTIGLDSWIIQDGNYGDFERGQLADFAVEFGEIALGIDPFDYFEGLHAVEGMPALIYSWRVDQIERQTAPFVEVAPKVFERDRAAWAWTDVDRTDAWNDDDGHAEYLLHCTLLDDLPRRKRTR